MTHQPLRAPARALLVLSALATTSDRSLDAQTIIDPNFAVDVIHVGQGMVPIAFGPDGRIYVGEKSGRILLFRRDPADPAQYLPPVTFADLAASVEDSNERGLLGLALHPDFETNRSVYVFYSYAGGQRLVRLTADASLDAVSGDPQTLLEGLPNSATNHNAGDIRFSPADGRLYITLGDDASSSEAQNLDAYHGKILRVDDDGNGLADNPFFDGGVDSVRSRIWGLGCRNPFRFTFQQATGVVYVSENGNTIDRVSRWLAGANGGWPREFANPSDPDVRNLVTPAVSITGIAIFRGGPFADPAFPGSDVVYVANWLENTISRWRLTGAELDSAVAVDGTDSFVSGLPNPSHLAIGPDRALYVTSASRNSAGSSALFRIRPVTGGVPPTAAFSTDPDPPEGPAPLTVTFFDESTDDGAVATWLWEFGDGEESGVQNPSHIYDAPGVYTASLTVSDSDGLENTASVEVTVTREVDLGLSGTILDGRSLDLPALPVPTELRFYQMDAVTPLAVPGGLGPDANVLDVGTGGSFGFSGTVLLTGDGFAVSAGEPADDGFQPARRGFAVAPGSALFDVTMTFVLSDTAVAGRITDTLENPATTDVGVSRGTPGDLFAVPGGRDFLAPIPPSGVPHRIESDEIGFYYVPVPSSSGDAEFHFDVVGDTNREVYLATTFQDTVASGALVERDVTLGLQSGGADCDPPPPLPGGAVDFGQVQEIFDRHCVGCHGGPDPNAGLDLSPGVSFSALVGTPSREVPGLNLVERGDPGLSFLWEKVNCSLPQAGVRMPTGTPLSLEEQALVHDWIAQLPTGSFRRSEANGDGRYDISDAIFVLRFLFDAGFPPAPCRDALDSDDDGSVTVSDAVFHLNFFFAGSLDLPPPPFPDCGVDPTVDALDCEQPGCP